ncbi:core histone h2A/H2B/H3/H4 domain-containing protein [Purpureocillium lavendulum]|uniref:Histone H4 n=1 Tax=Purpureocillium lavendulum TaxID=1247861 RepID=A0AB34G0N6_9HYPO|nr:core histone h2A/H2B/H3/H4 domain-containing protein [Purpureocillium lavendulum]
MHLDLTRLDERRPPPPRVLLLPAGAALILSLPRSRVASASTYFPSIYICWRSAPVTTTDDKGGKPARPKDMPTFASRGGPAQARRGRAYPTSSSAGGGKRHPGIAGKTVTGSKRHRRLARRGGVKRISAGIYDEIRVALRARLETILRICTAVIEYRSVKTVTVNDVIFALRSIGRPIYGFDSDTYDPRKKERREPLRDD